MTTMLGLAALYFLIPRSGGFSIPHPHRSCAYKPWCLSRLPVIHGSPVPGFPDGDAPNNERGQPLSLKELTGELISLGFETGKASELARERLDSGEDDLAAEKLLLETETTTLEAEKLDYLEQLVSNIFPKFHDGISGFPHDDFFARRAWRRWTLRWTRCSGSSRRASCTAPRRR